MNELDLEEKGCVLKWMSDEVNALWGEIERKVACGERMTGDFYQEFIQECRTINYLMEREHTELCDNVDFLWELKEEVMVGIGQAEGLFKDGEYTEVHDLIGRVRDGLEWAEAGNEEISKIVEEQYLSWMGLITYLQVLHERAANSMEKPFQAWHCGRYFQDRMNHLQYPCQCDERPAEVLETMRTTLEKKMSSEGGKK